MATEIKPIRTEANCDAALAGVEPLWAAKSGMPRGDRLDVLATLIEAYEERQYPMDPPDPVEAIKFRMEQQGLTRKDLEAMIGSRTRIAAVLACKRELLIAIIRRLQRATRDTGGGAHPAIPEGRGSVESDCSRFVQSRSVLN